jgi:hypothetical protein
MLSPEIYYQQTEREGTDMAEVIEGMVVIDEGKDPEVSTEAISCCWASFTILW